MSARLNILKAPERSKKVELKEIEPRNAISRFMEENYKHFNAGTLLKAAKAYKKHIDAGGKMMITLAGAMSTAELGISLAEMIRQGKCHAISCTGANLEEDIFNLVAHNSYIDIPNWRDMTPQEDFKLGKKALPRVTDTCIPENKAMVIIEDYLGKIWENAQSMGLSYFPHDYLFQLLKSGDLVKHYEIDPRNSWMLAAAERNLPIVCPCWEDSSLGNRFAALCIEGKLKSSIVKGGIDYMQWLASLYPELSKGQGIGFFQIGGGCAGDFPICVCPMLKLDLDRPEIPSWSYFCQISDAVTSYGGYSGALPREKASWGKLNADTPMFMIESDATIVSPLIFNYVMNK